MARHIHVHVHDAFEEGKHPRAENGEFSETNANTLSRNGWKIAGNAATHESMPGHAITTRTGTDWTHSKKGAEVTAVHGPNSENVLKGYLSAVTKKPKGEVVKRSKSPTSQKENTVSKSPTSQKEALAVASDLGGSNYAEVAKSSPPPSAAEAAALKDYTLSRFQYVNSSLREGWNSKEIDGDIATISGYLDRSKVSEPFTTLRVLKGSHAKNLNIQAGAEIDEKSFMSTTTNAGYAARIKAAHPSNVLLKIDVPQGTPAAAISHYGVGPAAGEAEILIQRGRKLKITSWDPETRTAHAQLINPSN